MGEGAGYRNSLEELESVIEYGDLWDAIDNIRVIMEEMR